MGEAITAVAGTQPPALLLYEGHAFTEGVEGKKHVNLCLKADHLVDTVLLGAMRDHAQSGGNERLASPATLVLNACVSARVDLRSVDGEVAVIAGTPDQIAPDARFAEAVAQAIQSPRLDRNCDGIVTDEELFFEMLRSLRALEQAAETLPKPELQAQPLLVRHARVQVPLPIPSQCPERRRAPRLTAPVNPELAEALRKQELFATTRGGQLPVLDWDYFVLVPRAGISEQVAQQFAAELVAGDRSRMLRPYPGGLAEATLLAEYTVFTEVFAVELWPRFARIVRLRDGTAVTKRIKAAPDLAAAFPFRRRDLETTTEADSGTAAARQTTRIIRDRAYAKEAPWPQWASVPCEDTLVGECFRSTQTVTPPNKAVNNATTPLQPDGQAGRAKERP